MTDPHNLEAFCELISKFDADEIIFTPDHLDSFRICLQRDYRTDITISNKQKKECKVWLSDDGDNQHFYCIIAHTKSNCVELIWVRSVDGNDRSGLMVDSVLSFHRTLDH